MSLGRPPPTTNAEIERVALALFARRGFEATTVEDIAAAVGVGRRTLFRYFESKNDIAWGDFDWVMERLRAALDEGADLPMMEALRRGVVESNRYPADEEPGLRRGLNADHRQRRPAGALGAPLRPSGAAWWRAGRRRGAAKRPPTYCAGDRYAALGSAMAAFERWVASKDEDLLELIDAAFVALAAGFDAESGG